MPELFREVNVYRFTRLLHPKLVTLVVSVGRDGRPNAMAASWTIPVSVRPPLLCVAISPKRYTLSLIRESKEFTVNVAGVDMIKEVEYLGRVSGRDEDKISKIGLELIPGKKTSTPVIAKAVAAMECKLHATYPAGDHQLVLGEVVAAYVRENCFREIYDIGRVRLLYHLGGRYYTTSGDRVFTVH